MRCTVSIHAARRIFAISLRIRKSADVLAATQRISFARDYTHSVCAVRTVSVRSYEANDRSREASKSSCESTKCEKSARGGKRRRKVGERNEHCHQYCVLVLQKAPVK